MKFPSDFGGFRFYPSKNLSKNPMLAPSFHSEAAQSALRGEKMQELLGIQGNGWPSEVETRYLYLEFRLQKTMNMSCDAAMIRLNMEHHQIVTSPSFFLQRFSCGHPMS